MSTEDKKHSKNKLKSDLNDGLVYAYILDSVGGGNFIDLEGILKWRPEEGPIWIHLDFTFDQAKEWLQKESELSRLSCEILMEDDTRPRFITNKDGFLLILRGINCNPGADPEDMVALRMSFEENRIITMRQRKVMAIDDIYNAIEAGNGPKSIVGFLTMVIDRTIYILSIITVVFLPLSFITGLLGINVGGIPGGGYKWAFLIVTCILVAIAVVLLTVFRRIKWL